MMANDEIWTMAREYAKHECAMSTLQDKKQLHEDKIIEFIDVVGFLCESHCIVSKEKVNELCRLTLEHDDSVDYGLIDGLTDIVCDIFGEQYHQAAETFKNSEV